MLKNYFFAAALLLVITGCAISRNPYSKSVPVSAQITTQKADTSRQTLELYFGVQTKPEKDYSQLAFVEAIGNQYTNPQELIQLLKWEASKYGADAIIEIQKSSTGREEGYLFDEEPEVQYQAPTFTGIAIKYLN